MIEHNHYVFMAEGLQSCLYVYTADGEQVEAINRTMMDDAPVLPDDLRILLLQMAPKHGILTVLVNGQYTYSSFRTPERILIMGPSIVINHLPYRHTINTQAPCLFRMICYTARLSIHISWCCCPPTICTMRTRSGKRNT